MNREDVLEAKGTIDCALDQLRDAVKLAKGDADLKASLNEVIKQLSGIKKGIKVPKAPSKPKEEPYRGGGTWHPPGMMPGGRYAPIRTKESW